MRKYETVIWDWNGTLLDDVQVCIESINHMLSDRGKNELTPTEYRDIFTFPVRRYYELAGFDLDAESFNIVAVQFIELYREKIKTCSLFPEARRTLEWLSGKGYDQYLISAMEHRFLEETLKSRGIDGFFSDYSGIHDHLADGKSSMAEMFIREKGIDPKKTIFIGDTLHDHEVAVSLGMHCMLVSGGHQSEVRLQRSGCRVVKSLAEVMDNLS